MNGLMRWDPFREMASLRQAMDRLFEDTFRPAVWRTELAAIVPPIDMIETDKELVVKAMLPGVTEDDISIDIVGDTLTIKGETKAEKEEKGESHIYRECRYGSFSRSVTLPAGLKTDKAEAELENGVLKVVIPKAETAKPKAIKVKSKKAEKAEKTAEKAEK